MAKQSNRARGRGAELASGEWVSPYGARVLLRQAEEGLEHHAKRIAKRVRKTVEGEKV